jgi:hypothetical protein
MACSRHLFQEVLELLKDRFVEGKKDLDEALEMVRGKSLLTQGERNQASKRYAIPVIRQLPLLKIRIMSQIMPNIHYNSARQREIIGASLITYLSYPHASYEGMPRSHNC